MADSNNPNQQDAQGKGVKSYPSKYMDPTYKGEKLSDELKNGPMERRKCTDCIFCLIFFAFLLAWVICGFYGLANGDPVLLTYPYDSSENQCGLPGDDAEDFPFIYFPYPVPGYLDYSVCVKDCPTDYNQDLVECYTNDQFKDCEFRWEDVIGDPHPIYGYLEGIYPSDGYVKRICLPDSDAKSWTLDALSEVNDKIDVETMGKWLGDVWRIWYTMLIVAGFAIIFAAVYLLFLRWCLGVVVWLSILIIFCFLLAIGAFCHWSYEEQFEEENDEDTTDTLLAFAIIFYVLAGLFLIYILWMCNKIRLAIAIMKAGTVFLKDVWSAFLVPPGFLLAGILIFCYWVVCSVYIYGTGEIKQNDSDNLAEIEWDQTTRNAFYFHFFGIFWVVSFIIALEQFVMASAVCLWYFSQNTDSSVQRPISRSLWRGFRYHMGSLALGSLILAIVWVIKTIMAYVAAKIMSIDTFGQSKIVVMGVKCMMCCVHCFERFIKFLNKNAYIQIALNGSSFCTAAREAFFLILRNAGRFIALGGLGHIFQFLGKWSIASAATFSGYVLITRSEDIYDEIHSPVFPTILFALISYLIAALVMSVYSMACDTIMHCFLADEELMAKDDRLPAHAPDAILNFMNREKNPEHGSKGCCRC